MTETELVGGQLTARAARIATIIAKHGLQGSRRGRRRPARPAARDARGARPDVRQARPDPLDAARPDPAGRRRGAGAPPGRRAAADRGAGRPGDGGGARRPVGGRVRAASNRSRSRPGRSAQVHRARLEGGAPRRGEGAAARTRPRRSSATSDCSRSSRRRPRVARRSPGWSTSRPSSSISRRRCGASSTSARRPANIERMREVLINVPTARSSRRADADLHEAAARDGRGRRRRAAARRPPGRSRPRGGEAAARVVLPAGADRGVLPRRPPPGQPAVGRRPDLPPRPRHGRHARRGDARPPAPAAARLLARGRRLPRRRAAHARRDARRRRHRVAARRPGGVSSGSFHVSTRSTTSSSARCSTR